MSSSDRIPRMTGSGPLVRPSAPPGFGVPVAYGSTGQVRRRDPWPDPDRPGYYQGYPLAGWGRRVAASLLDALVVALLYLPGTVVFLLAADQGPGPDSAIFVVLGIVLDLLAVCLTLWNQLAVQGRTGQTWGKQAIGIRLLRKADGRPLGTGLVFLRSVLHVLDSLPCYLGYLWPLWDARRQTLADKVVGSLVVDERPAAARTRAPEPVRTG